MITTPAVFCFRLHPTLKGTLNQLAHKSKVPLNEYIAGLLAREVGRPDLAFIPRKKRGRPRKKR